MSAPDSDLDFAARRLDAAYAQVAQAARVVQLARAIANPLAGVGDVDADVERLRKGLDDYDHAAARAAALNEGSTGR